ncbi:15308_t:CDS:2 [Funneliformis caledonium]|uniref:Kinesin-like protein n=1 Tax=Funneliformis caledonium TaxID=1117310 RepID=A0A9N8ZCE0_9GLOM|nr:15308_t:CDS:2 [Funneliformis caledonium]
MLTRQYKTNSKRKRAPEEILVSRNVKHSTTGNASTSERNLSKNVTAKKVLTKASIPRRPLYSNKVVTINNSTVKTLPISSKPVLRSNKSIVSHKNATTSYPGTRPVPYELGGNFTGKVYSANLNKAELARFRSEIAQHKKQLAEIQREAAESEEYNKAIEAEFPGLHDELTKVKLDCDIMLADIEQSKVLDEQLNVMNEENNRLHENVQKLNQDLRYKNEKIAEQKSLQESRLRQIQESYNGLNSEENTRKELHNQLLDLKGNIRVMCRVRPCTDGENDVVLAKLKCSDDKRSIEISTERMSLWRTKVDTSTFKFDCVFDQKADQDQVFSEISPLVQSAIDGYNVCIFAYGQTGSGKTYTMEGDVNNPEKKGMIPRAIDVIFDKIKELEKLGWKFEAYVQYVEIYNETIQDLLGDENKTNNERKKLHKKTYKESKDLYKIMYNESTRMTIVENAERRKVSRKEDMESLLRKASNRRSKASTNSNLVSSRSHGVFIFHLEGEYPIGNASSRGSLSLIDLAGSENIDKSGSTGNQLKETQNINKSLSDLKTVIQQIKDKASYVNYRDSMLTNLLKYSLGGTAKVCMLVNVSPFADSVNETKNSLTFGQTARKTHVGTASRSGRF